MRVVRRPPRFDPWGATARYLSASLKYAGISADIKHRLSDQYVGKLVFDTKEMRKIHFFFNDWNSHYSMRELATKKSLGVLIYGTRAKPEQDLTLVAKTRASNNHMIVELFNAARREWETHNFFGEARFSKQESLSGDAGYDDYVHYYQAKGAR